MIPCTLKDENDRNRSIEKGTSTNECTLKLGNTNQRTIVQKKVKIGDRKNKTPLACVGIKNSLIMSFKPSANGCNNPNKPTMPGPRLRCTDPKVFRSNNINKAIDINMLIIPSSISINTNNKPILFIN